MSLALIESDAGTARAHEPNTPGPLPDYKARYGDVWAIGPHRLLVGDSTNRADVLTLLGGTQIDQILTDPPYGVDYADRTRNLQSIGRGRLQDDGTIVGDMMRLPEAEKFFGDFLRAAAPNLSDHNTCHIFMGGKLMPALHRAFLKAGYTAAGLPYLAWVKNRKAFGRADYKGQHELILYGWYKRHRFYGQGASSCLFHRVSQRNEWHPTQKPVGLLSELIGHGCPMRGVVYDPFAGSGSTIVAAEETDRRCFAIEKVPEVADRALDRLRAYGLDVRLIWRGEP